MDQMEKYGKTLELYGGNRIPMGTVGTLKKFLSLLPDGVDIPEIEIKLHNFGNGVLEINKVSDWEAPQ